jgi:hypothetical protein
MHIRFLPISVSIDLFSECEWVLRVEVNELAEEFAILLYNFPHTFEGESVVIIKK